MEDAHTREPPTDESRGSPFVWLSVPTLLLLYFLSIGPAAWLHLKFPASRPAIEVIYAPVGYLAEKSDPFQHALDWYFTKIWGVHLI